MILENGYYLSTYLDIDAPWKAGLSQLRHDQNMSLWLKVNKKITLVHHYELERYSRNRHHRLRFKSVEAAKKFITSCLRRYNLDYSDLQGICGTPEIDVGFITKSELSLAPYSRHSVAHLYTSLCFTTHSNQILGMAVDAAPDPITDAGLGDGYMYAGMLKQGNRVTMFPVASPGLLWAEAAVQFKTKEGTLMALGTACPVSHDPSGLSDPKRIFRARDIGTAKQDFNRAVDAIDTLVNCKQLRWSDPRFTLEEARKSGVVRILDYWSRRLMVENVERIQEQEVFTASETSLMLAGGFGLNCPTNSFLMRHYGFQAFQSCPCVNDSGLAIGIGLLKFNECEDGITANVETPYLGEYCHHRNSYSMSDQGANLERTDRQEGQMALDITEGLVGAFFGRAEIGPRALGARSILGDPRTIATREVMNTIKQREWWQPVAPLVLEEYLEEWFDETVVSPHMLLVMNIKKERQHLVPAIVHMDGTARIQTVNESQNAQLYKILQAFYGLTGIPMVCNTSLNARGEPIIHTPHRALSFAKETGIPITYIGAERFVMSEFSTSDTPSLNYEWDELWCSECHEDPHGPDFALLLLTNDHSKRKFISESLSQLKVLSHRL